MYNIHGTPFFPLCAPHCAENHCAPLKKIRSVRVSWWRCDRHASGWSQYSEYTPHTQLCSPFQHHQSTIERDLNGSLSRFSRQRSLRSLAKGTRWSFLRPPRWQLPQNTSHVCLGNGRLSATGRTDEQGHATFHELTGHRVKYMTRSLLWASHEDRSQFWCIHTLHRDHIYLYLSLIYAGSHGREVSWLHHCTSSSTSALTPSISSTLEPPASHWGSCQQQKAFYTPYNRHTTRLTQSWVAYSHWNTHKFGAS